MVFSLVRVLYLVAMWVAAAAGRCPRHEYDIRLSASLVSDSGPFLYDQKAKPSNLALWDR